MPNANYTLFRNAILAEQQVVCRYDGRPRELCPHIIGTNRNGEEAVFWRKRHTLPASFFLACLAAMELERVVLQEI